MTPAVALAMLDWQMRAHGQDGTLRLAGTTTPVTYTDAPVRAFVRGFRPDELVGTIQQGDRRVILRNTEVAAHRAPRKGDRLVLNGGTTTVQDVETRQVVNTVISHWLVVRG